MVTHTSVPSVFLSKISTRIEHKKFMEGEGQRKYNFKSLYENNMFEVVHLVSKVPQIQKHLIWGATAPCFLIKCS